jgi:hypothetical protein
MSEDSNAGGEGRPRVQLIGLVLLVSLTAVAAVVIGGYVLQESGPQTPDASFEADERVVEFGSAYGPPENNEATLATLRLVEGDSIALSQVDVIVNGSASAWGPRSTETLDIPEGEGSYLPASPYPNVLKLVGTTESVSVTPGEQWHLLVYEGWNDTDVVNAEYESEPAFDGQSGIDHRGPGAKLRAPHDSSGLESPLRERPLLMSGDTIEVVWQSESGTERQTLYTYTVQTDSPVGRLG